MDELLDELRTAFENNGYDVDDTSRNRKQIRLVILEEGANAPDLREIVHETVGESAVLGLNVTTESVEGQDDLNTVVTFRHRPA